MKDPIAVSDHALVRYLERVGGFDLSKLRQELGTRVADAAKAGATTVTMEGFAYRIGRDADGRPVLLTVLPVRLYKKMRPQPGRKPQPRAPKGHPE
jgi:hypothetical protein